MYSPDEIEKKRLMALKLRQARIQKQMPIVTVSTLFKNDQKKQSNLTLKTTNNSSHTINPPPQKQAKLLNTIKPGNFLNHVNVIKGTYRMITTSRFEIDVPYYQPLIEFFKKFPSKSYDQQSKLWNFDIKEYDKFRDELKIKFSHIQLVGIPKFVIQTFLSLQANDQKNDVDLSRIDRTLWNTLMPFQREGIAFGVQKKGRCFIADDMGLGKTIQALGIADYYKDDWPLLIVAPSSVRYQWSNMIFEYLPFIPTQQVHQFKNGKDHLGNEKITIISYDLLTKSIDIFEEQKFRTIILDESHLLKNHKTDRTKAIQRLMNHASRIILLSGTPALSRPIELYSQLNLIMGSFMRLQEYGVRYCNGKKAGYGWDFSGSSNITELQLLLRARCLLRRLKADVLKQLPAKIRQVVILDPALIDAKSKKMEKITTKLNKNSLMEFERHSSMMEVYNLSSTQKLRAVRNYVKDLLEHNKKFLIFAHHQCVLIAICEVLDGKNIEYIKIDGKTSTENRNQYVNQFQNCEQCMVAVLSITAANAGITLTAAHFVVFAELYWNPGILIQAEDRVHRIGQNYGVLIQYLLAKDTVDDYLWPLIQRKLHFLTKAGLNQDFSFSQSEVSAHKASPDDQQSACSTNVQSKIHSFVHINNLSVSPQNSTNISDMLSDDEEVFANINLDHYT